MLVDDGHLVVITRTQGPTSWDADLASIIPRYTTNREFRYLYDHIGVLVNQEMFTPVGD
jgi:hypothetical protein